MQIPFKAAFEGAAANPMNEATKRKWLIVVLASSLMGLFGLV